MRIGLDIGSRTGKVVLAEGGRILERRVVPTDPDLARTMAVLLEGLPEAPITATGYGRHLVKARRPDAATMTEISAAAAAARALRPECRALLDLGGQDTKAVALDGRGRVARFVLNDRCAAGTGRALEMIAAVLGFSLADFAAAAHAAEREEAVTSMCAVFAETEVVSLVARGVPRAAIARGLHAAVAARLGALLRQVALGGGPILFAGGGALNPCLAGMLRQAFGAVEIPEDPQCLVAFGAAIGNETRR